MYPSNYSWLDNLSRRWESNPRPTVYETAALPLSHFGTPILNSGLNIRQNHPLASYRQIILSGARL